jgi:hypothetical protein
MAVSRFIVVSLCHLWVCYVRPPQLGVDYDSLGSRGVLCVLLAIILILILYTNGDGKIQDILMLCLINCVEVVIY